MTTTRRTTFGLTALLTIGLLSPILSFSQSQTPPDEPERELPQLTPQQRAAAASDGSSSGRASTTQTGTQYVNQYGGERNGGTVDITTNPGQWRNSRGQTVTRGGPRNE